MKYSLDNLVFSNSFAALPPAFYSRVQPTPFQSAARLLLSMIRSGRRPAKRFHTFDYLTGIPSQCTFIEPCRSIYALLDSLEKFTRSTLSPGRGLAQPSTRRHP